MNYFYFIKWVCLLYLLAGLPLPIRSAIPPPLVRPNCKVTFPEGMAIQYHTIRIPFRLVGRLIAVKAKVDTIAGTFFFDTGSDRLLLNSRLFKGGQPIANRNNLGITGNIGRVREQRIDTLFWDNLSIPNITANIVDLSHIETTRNIELAGILGYNVFEAYEVFIDYTVNQLIVTKLDHNGFPIDENPYGEVAIDSLSFRLKRHAILLEGQIQGVPLLFHLDTGAELNLLDRKIKRPVLQQFKILKRVNLMGAGQESVEALAGILSGLVLTQQKNYGMRTLLTNLSSLNRIIGTKIDGVLGYEFLRPRRTVINYKRRKLYFFKMVRP